MMFYLKILLRLLIIGACLYGFHLFSAEAQWDQALSHASTISGGAFICALLFTLISYLALVGYDWLGLRFLQQRIPLRFVTLVTGLANAVSNMLGFALFSGGAVRYRLYSQVGVSGGDIAKLSLFCTATFLSGSGLVAALGLLLYPDFFTTFVSVPIEALRYAAAIFLILGLIVPLAAGSSGQLKIFGFTFTLPNAQTLYAQFIVGALDITAVAGVLFVLLPEHQINFFAFVTLFSAALMLGLVSHVPAGLGVFEGIMVAGLAPYMDASGILGALIVYRLIYYGLPFLLAVAYFVVSETRQLLALHPHTRATLAALARMPETFLPTVLAGLIALGGIVLLASGATPASSGRVAFIADYLPMSLIEGSHLFASIVGLLLLVVARGVYFRYDSAYIATLLLLAAGALLSLFKGFDYEESITMIVIFALVAPSRRAFRRSSRLSTFALSPSWLMFIGLSLATTIWLLFFSFKYVEYDKMLWWQIALDDTGDASRSLRSTLVLCVLAMVIAVYQLFRPARHDDEKPCSADFVRAAEIASHAQFSNANLALLGDKHFLFSKQRDAFLMYSVRGRSYIAMGDPVGNPDQFDELIWRFREMADRAHSRAALYQVSADLLPLYVDSGFQLVKLGEEALLPLASFSLEGSTYRDARQAINRAARDGMTFDIISAADVPSVEPELRRVSDSWLAIKSSGEKGFSLGAYSADYIRHFDVAVVRHNGCIVAFTNMWKTESKRELSVDLMRHDQEHRVMDFLFTSLMLWGKKEGYTYFNLGMAPLAGLITHQLAPLWTRLGTFLFQHGERFYNFQGLHAFKEKYNPEWQPRYLAYAGGSVLRVLIDVALLIAGGVRALWSK